MPLLQLDYYRAQLYRKWLKYYKRVDGKEPNAIRRTYAFSAAIQCKPVPNL